jgi:hypothetical protein
MLMTRYGKKSYESGKDIYSNYHLNGIDYTPIASIRDIDKIKDGVFLADELWLWLFSRTSMTKLNQELMKIVMLNRKRNVDIYYTAQLHRSVDVMLREVTRFFVYPHIRPFQTKEGETTFRLCFYITDLTGARSSLKMLKHPLSYWGQFYDTTEEISNLKQQEETPLQKGIQLEEKFVKALSKIDFIKHVELLPNSGSHSTWNFDVVTYAKGKTLAFDVKGVCQSRVYLNIFGNGLQNKIKNAKEHNAVPYLAFPRNDRVQLTNPNYWYIYPLNHYSYLLSLSSNPAYKKLVKNSQKLVDLSLKSL